MRKEHARLDSIMRMIANCDAQLEYMVTQLHYQNEIKRVVIIRKRLYGSYANQLSKMFQCITEKTTTNQPSTNAL